MTGPAVQQMSMPMEGCITPSNPHRFYGYKETAECPWCLLLKVAHRLEVQAKILAPLPESSKELQAIAALARAGVESASASLVPCTCGAVTFDPKFEHWETPSFVHRRNGQFCYPKQKLKE